MSKDNTSNKNNFISSKNLNLDKSKENNYFISYSKYNKPLKPKELESEPDTNPKSKPKIDSDPTLTTEQDLPKYPIPKANEKEAYYQDFYQTNPIEINLEKLEIDLEQPLTWQKAAQLCYLSFSILPFNKFLEFISIFNAIMDEDKKEQIPEHSYVTRIPLIPGKGFCDKPEKKEKAKEVLASNLRDALKNTLKDTPLSFLFNNQGSQKTTVEDNKKNPLNELLEKLKQRTPKNPPTEPNKLPTAGQVKGGGIGR